MPRVGKLKSGIPVQAKPHMRVEKTGRTTGYTVGTVFEVHAHVGVSYPHVELTFSDQILIRGGRMEVFSKNGDSGALIVDKASKRPTGLLLAVSETITIANHIKEVLDKLDVASRPLRS